MIVGEDFFLCNVALHDRFYLATQVLEGIISNASRAITIAELSGYTGYPKRALRVVCASLQKVSLLKPDPVVASGWRLACHPSQVTLEDVFQSVTANIGLPRGRPSARMSGDVARDSYIDIFLMQATLAANQSVRKQLRQFSLDRLKSYPLPPSQFAGRSKTQKLE